MTTQERPTPTFDGPIESVAVGVPTKDNEDSIRATLESLLEQHRQPDRIIVVDASTDRTPEIVRDVAESTDVEIALLEETTHGRGISAARQQIYEALEEDLLACLDTEKRVEPDWVETHLEFHREHPEFGVLNAGPEVEGEVENPKTYDFFVQANCSIKREVLDLLGGWDRWMNRGEDWDFRIRLWRAGVRSYSTAALAADLVVDESPYVEISKMSARPGCVAFLRKYGRWYASFYPIHVLGDVASAVSIAATALAVLLAPLTLGGSLALGAVPLTAFAVYVYFDYGRAHGVPDARELALRLPRFYLLGYTALRELLYAEDYDWNYGGVERDGR
ncbi:glycosyltransferase family 2 protein [Halarchaeum sp. CBA1220]|uniref:glycosyltransferase n=1 Tax=Halarchaeum sp. CBA1220 TaxID=1853682 RepID=UPI000F3A99F8|nr:glycosyltransferase family A protein [Halarchaeum sp. CBA1220]QLC34410.1 glycosyltransferase family 2 protein [Halarchaeum sp. CBA1220]